ncbi:uncharacterized protein AMSG_01974 [Thecamonas trahens ATCC 50062]|uniref:Uncharacterized protein n=1 Tax=Thecamonas trahens ATCC 50062 TaxID=461836 RepID=A0A0L0DUQ2_THETB|nr:hypothetical protein AMSG_01974 [Thecamonas trahens ATCC 50062]KNC55960.1 hypothetical protein AMSG_01974 [Thecamonas trahens ATCC 50062]|eukprot:XP_013761007.1 hypothetical protein AMSG_01974 [Thecamonas trahens ATCC 50062]
MASLSRLPAEIACDVVALALTSKGFHAVLLGSAFMRRKVLALRGAIWCTQRAAWGAALLALSKRKRLEVADALEMVNVMVRFPRHPLWSQLLGAVVARQPEVLRRAIRVDRGRPQPLVAVLARHGAEDGVRYLLSRGDVDAAADGNAAIIGASREGHVGVVALLLGRNEVDPGVDSNCALRLAAEAGHADVVTALLGHPGVDAGASNNVALRGAVFNGNAAVVDRLLSSGSVVVGNNCYWISPQARSRDIVRLVSRTDICAKVYCLE